MGAEADSFILGPTPSAVPHEAERLYAEARQLKASNNWPAAEANYRRIVVLRPDYLNAWINLGLAQRKLGDAVAAEASQREAVRLAPDNFMATLNLGNALFDQKRFEEAAEWFARTVALNSACAEAHSNLGYASLRRWRSDSIPHFLRAIELKPGYYDPAEGVGLGLFHIGHFDEAAAAFQTALQIRPDSSTARLFLARAFLAARRFDEATVEFEELARSYPGLPAAKSGLATILARQGKYTKPLSLYEESLADDPEDLWTRFQYALLLLRAGDYVKGWRNYDDARPYLNEGFALSLNRHLEQPRWQGESLAGKTVLVVAEQGIGDEVMFASVLPDLIREAAHCVIECDQRLESLFVRSFVGATIVAVDRKNNREWYKELPAQLSGLPPIDCWTAAGSLPRYRRDDAARFPQHQGYLRSDASSVANWQERLAALGPGLKVGISWRGGTPVTNGALRSLDLTRLMPVLGNQDAHFVNLQYGDCAKELATFEAGSGIHIHDWLDVTNDFDGCAALVSALDLVISVCTSLVHLTGAVGRPVWVMAPYVAEWRYGRESQSMIWYPSVRMFRQTKADEWQPVIASVGRQLRKMTDHHMPARSASA